MNDIMMTVGDAITRFLIDSYPHDYLHAVFSEKDLAIDDLVDQILMELIKYAYDSTQEEHSIRYYLNRADELTDDVRMKYSRLMKISNDYKEKELDFFERNFGFAVEKDRPPKMQSIDDKLEGYLLSEMKFFEITNIGDLELIKAVINHRLDSSKKVSNKRFREIVEQYDKMVISLMEQSQESDEKMVFNSLAYFSLEWKYAFDFIYDCAVSMRGSNISKGEEAFTKIGILLGYRVVESILGISVSSDSRMVGYREKLIPLFFDDERLTFRYSEFLSLMVTVKEKVCHEGTPIKQWFTENTDVHDWASFLREYDVFRHARQKKDLTNQVIRNMRAIISVVFPENPENRSYSSSPDDAILWVQHLKEAIPMDKLDCYIEEYKNESGSLCARLRDKASNKCVVIQGDDAQKRHLLRFLSTAKKHIDVMPTIFQREGKDVVAVRGIIKNRVDDSLEVSLEALGAGYLFQ